MFPPQRKTYGMWISKFRIQRRSPSHQTAILTLDDHGESGASSALSATRPAARSPPRTSGGPGGQNGLATEVTSRGGWTTGAGTTNERVGHSET